jgi:hypothetical protein
MRWRLTPFLVGGIPIDIRHSSSEICLDGTFRAEMRPGDLMAETLGFDRLAFPWGWVVAWLI